MAREIFADRAYEADGSLTPRSLPGSVITDAQEVVARTVLDGERSPRRVLEALPLLAWVAATRPRHWGEWLAVLR